MMSQICRCCLRSNECYLKSNEFCLILNKYCLKSTYTTVIDREIFDRMAVLAYWYQYLT